MPRPSTRSLRWLIIAAALLLLLGWLAQREPAQLASVQPATRGPITQVLAEEGRTRLKARYVVSAPVAGTLRRITLQPGDAVRAGEVVAWIEPAISGLLDASSRARAEADMQAGQSQQAAAHERMRAARAAWQQARTALARATRLHKGNTLSQEALEQAQTRARTTAAELAAARADEQAAVQRVRAAQAVLAQEGRSRDEAAPLPVHAPVDGVILHRAQESRTTINAGQPLLTLGNPQALELEAEVLSSDAVQLAPGMTARVLRWGGEGELWATVRRIEPGAFTKVSALGVEEQRTRVILDLSSPPAQWQRLGDGYRVELEFILKHEDEVLRVPVGALFRVQDRQADGQPAQSRWALFRVQDGRARRTLVRTGVHAATTVQIIDGLAEGERVIIQPDDRIRDGTRIDAHDHEQLP
ncbi:MAG: HlyD family efflux transporter periplasmic adaptor subunit [Lautropia sp.]|nr:HlyD family efflux transporter periplasmic adaptor subunit [Lautropia sp.]